MDGFGRIDGFINFLENGLLGGHIIIDGERTDLEGVWSAEEVRASVEGFEEAMVLRPNNMKHPRSPRLRGTLGDLKVAVFRHEKEEDGEKRFSYGLSEDKLDLPRTLAPF